MQSNIGTQNSRLFIIINSRLKPFEDLHPHFANRFNTTENLFYEQGSRLEGKWCLNSIRMKSRDWYIHDLNDSYKSWLKRSRLRRFSVWNINKSIHWWPQQQGGNQLCLTMGNKTFQTFSQRSFAASVKLPCPLI